VSAIVMDGTAVANRILTETADRAVRFERTQGRKPCLATVLVGDDPASHTYVRMKTNRCAATGLDSQRHLLPENATTGDAVALVTALAGDDTVDGILVQHPMPAQIDERAVFEAITAAKDVDGVTAASFAAIALGTNGFQSCTPGGILRLLDAYNVELAGKHAVVIGRGPILGRPVGMLLLARDTTVTYCHSKTTDLADHVRGADIVVDAGYNPGNIGDVEYVPAAERAQLITPVPGGVGPTTIAVLLDQTVDAAELAAMW
jgi:methylenetetrahydrofolate dehydrogenase (NADP+)/methenyltetrahydrofolate cyclohydrolase